MIKIFVDSVSDMPDEYLERYNITMIPLTVNLGGLSYEDRSGLTLDEFFAEVRRLDEFPTSAAPAPQKFIDAFRPHVEAGDDILCFTMSSASSATFTSATLAKAEYPDANIAIIDTKCAGMCQGINAITAARLIESGKGFDEVVAASQKRVPRLKTLVLLETMEFLRRGGRISATTARLASLLSIKPVIEYMASTDGNIELIHRSRGFQKGMKWMVELTQSLKKDFSNSIVVIEYSTDPKPAYEIKSMLEKVYQLGEVIIAPIGKVVGTHVGPKAVGVFFEMD
ncbi:DegV family protein [Eubacteriales bacterium OttesenSCG-928-N14]|nr:DegV family protein [Eubacteriales bacterium OttesenSCG-928-N14]